ncbi:acetyl-CoA C-acyltransferase [Seongchinamella sediminis]|uniref:Acetyl-CoA C-acyltransferase n=1 Tax=Seongchinamella sediminis TaxID=2283635 RepID=A0A3L7E2E8_9GAMM|nr:acetyl-CoA C-acyltransferase [Seongchinamella sediminis]RLQ22533.1 acetyl-CoA C-acyltransferase [Seongchinamella sediminis]
MKNAVIYDAIRSPRGRAKDTGGLHELTPQALLQQLYQALGERTGLDPARVGDVILGCATQHGEQAGNIAKNSTLYAGWPASVPGMTINRYCSSGIDSVALAALKVQAGQVDTAIGGGVEMMSRVPMLADDARVFKDPAYAARCQMLMMGNGADLVATLYGVSREQADALAASSQQRAAHAREAGYFSSIVPITREDGSQCAQDECIRPETTVAGLAAMEPAFAKAGAMGVDDYQLARHSALSAVNHIHTAGNSPAMADGASLVLVAAEGTLDARPRARIVASNTVAADPTQVLSGCVEAVRALLAQEKLSAADVDLFEVHEAFAAISVMGMRELDIAEDRYNVNGGVIALGHPMGATGGMMLGTLLDELERRDLQRGIVSAAGAAGSGSAILIERLN